MKQSEHKFNELDLWKMLKDKGVPLWIILEMLQKVRKEKEAQNNSVQNSTAIEDTSETRLNEVM
ncbi:HIT family protein [Bacillus cereus]|nr:HIT family protein [Bacillus cereus]